MATKALPSPEVLRQLLRYEPETGRLFWREREPKPGTYWKDARGISHFLTDPEWDRLGYVEVPAPACFAR